MFPREEIIPPLNPEEDNGRTRTQVERSGWGERRVTPKAGERAQGWTTEYLESTIGKKLNSFKIYYIVGEILYSKLKKVR